MDRQGSLEPDHRLETGHLLHIRHKKIRLLALGATKGKVHLHGSYGKQMGAPRSCLLLLENSPKLSLSSCSLNLELEPTQDEVGPLMGPFIPPPTPGLHFFYLRLATHG